MKWTLDYAQLRPAHETPQVLCLCGHFSTTSSLLRFFFFIFLFFARFDLGPSGEESKRFRVPLERHAPSGLHKSCPAPKRRCVHEPSRDIQMPPRNDSRHPEPSTKQQHPCRRLPEITGTIQKPPKVFCSQPKVYGKQQHPFKTGECVPNFPMVFFLPHISRFQFRTHIPPLLLPGNIRLMNAHRIARDNCLCIQLRLQELQLRRAPSVMAFQCGGSTQCAEAQVS